MSENFLLNTGECQPNSTESKVLGHTFSNKKNKNNSSKQKFSIGYLRGT